MTEPLKGKKQHNYFSDSDQLAFRRGDEVVHVGLEHPYHETLHESVNNEHENDQLSIWKKPRGVSKPPVISSLFATRGARTDVGTALGVTALHSLRRFNHLPTASWDLSQHSLPIAQRLIKATKEKKLSGAERMSIPTDIHNDTTQNEEQEERAKDAVRHAFWSKTDNFESVPAQDIEHGRNIIRNLVSRNDKRRNLNKQQFSQPKLPFNER